MFAIDERLKGLPVLREQVVALYESLNLPHLAVPGRSAGPAKGFILGLRGPSGFAVFVYLFLPETTECAVYAPSNRSVPPDRYQSEESEALGFVESMGFIMDNLNFRGRPVDEQEQMLRTFPVFLRDPSEAPPPPSAPRGVRPNTGQQALKPPTGKQPAAPAPASASVAALGKLFGAFAVLLACMGGPGCAHVASDKEAEAASIHYDLGVTQQTSNPQAALSEFDAALALNDDFPEAHNARGVLLHNFFGRPEEAVAEYRKALAQRPGFSEAKANLGNVYLTQKRYDDAIALYREALNDMLYPTPYFAQGNLGWALYLKGDVDQGISRTRAAITINPRFCLGYRNLGTMLDAKGQTEEACRQFGKYRENCPAVAEAYQREGLCQAKLGALEEAKKSLGLCVAKATDEALKDDCQRLQEKL